MLELIELWPELVEKVSNLIIYFTLLHQTAILCFAINKINYENMQKHLGYDFNGALFCLERINGGVN